MSILHLKTISFFLLSLFLFSSCSPALTEEAIATEILEQAAARTQTAAVLPSETHTPERSLTPSLTALPMLDQIATAQALFFGPHGDGVYQVGVTIATGLWRSIPQRQDRYCTGRGASTMGFCWAATTRRALQKCLSDPLITRWNSMVAESGFIWGKDNLKNL